jgi:transcriptional regulator with GAF, ATPase, and Fis domain
VRAHEVLALVASSRGDLDAAAGHAADADRAAAQVPGRAGIAAQSRAASLAGSALLAAGSIDRAIAAYERAADLAERAGERHAAASATVNLGLARLDAAQLGPAIAALRDGSRRLAALRRPRELGRALYNLANAAFVAGDDALAQLAATRARAAAAEVGDADAAALAAIVLADLEVRGGRLRAAIRALDAIPAGTAGALVACRAAIAHAALGEIEAARSRAARARELAGGALEAEIAIAEARVALAAAEGPLAEAAAARAMAAARTFEARNEALLAGADAAEACGHRSEAAARLAQARALLDRAAAGLDAAAKARYRAIPGHRRALAALPAADAPLRRDAGRAAPLALARRIAAEPHPSGVVRQLASAALDLTGAERAFVLARAHDGAISIREGQGLSGALGPEHRPSRSIAARVIDERRPMVSVDAIEDARLDRAASVHAMALRSVLAVPLPARDATLALYVDDRLRPAAFDDATVADLAALAELGAASLATAERAREERREARIAARKQRLLEAALEARSEELRSLRRGPADPLAAIVGESTAMRRVIALASRVASSGATVLLVGESGTGKEMIARAIHAADVRRERPFVAESCAAIPETLLESTLFGHVRGAFTGADRARRGLFEVAHGGTLFLDEIADTSPAMQAKLLRVLQEGEIRPVGSERVRRIDARVIAAAGPDVDERIADGRFREDLYYRLAVVRVEIPPLRERVEDVAPLAAHFVALHAGGRKVRLEPGALELLRAHAWPGNVRELENEIRRALLAGGSTISAADLSPSLGSGEPAGDELDLKAQIESLERRSIERALAIHGGNQTRAAKALGVSRFGLQKMLRRLSIAADRS